MKPLMSLSDKINFIIHTGDHTELTFYTEETDDGTVTVAMADISIRGKHHQLGTTEFGRGICVDSAFNALFTEVVKFTEQVENDEI